MYMPVVPQDGQKPYKECTAKNQRRLSHVLMRITLLVALVLGMTAGLLQLVIDLRREKESVANNAEQFLDSVSNSASAAVYNYNNEAAKQVAEGLFKQPAIQSVIIQAGDSNKPMVMRSRQVQRTLPEFGALTQADEISVHRLLREPPESGTNEVIGSITVMVDRSVVPLAIVNRMLLYFLLACVKNFILGLLLVIFVFAALARHVISLAEAVAAWQPGSGEIYLPSPPRFLRRTELDILCTKIIDLAQHAEQTIDRLSADRDEAKETGSQFANKSLALSRIIDEQTLELRYAEERALRLTEIIDESLHEVYVFDAQTLKILEFNRGAAENLGLDANELHALTPADINAEYDVDTFRNKLQPLLDGTKKEVRFDSIHRRVDGCTYPVNLHLQLFTKSMPHVFVGFIIDITERKNLERQIFQSKKLESMGQLAAGIAHELNTPAQFVGDNIRFLGDSFEHLLTLTNSCSALTDAVNDDNITPELLETITQNIKSADLDYLKTEIPTAIAQSMEGVTRISKIVLAMKEFSHPGGESMELVDLNKVITNTIVVASNEWKYVARLMTDLDPDLVNIRCFSQEISQVLLNIIVNSAHAITEKNGGPSDVLGEIYISTRQTQDFVELRVQDTGVGIPFAIQERVFDHFFTTKEVGKGSGQGLSMAYKVIVDQHGGKIRLDSNENQGTTFVVSLPLHQNKCGTTGAAA
ncbi:MAG: PAS domain S-box-containing protein [Granulosicoccus sp.]|jgi:PAS domain S-box-containing protein